MNLKTGEDLDFIGFIFTEDYDMARKKTVEVEPEVVDVTAVVGDIEKAGETVEMIWVETVDELGRHMIQVPKKG